MSRRDYHLIMSPDSFSGVLKNNITHNICFNTRVYICKALRNLSLMHIFVQRQIERNTTSCSISAVIKVVARQVPTTVANSRPDLFLLHPLHCATYLATVWPLYITKHNISCKLIVHEKVHSEANSMKIHTML